MEVCQQPHGIAIGLLRAHRKSTARLISTGRRLILGLGANDRPANAIARLHGELFRART